ncbi:hypothetical protein [Streptomyces sp. NPDC001744]|uniref:hypothetical protein n=1 Tax=Streptomyces sp. NPDC001744 TaxID=3364606 RepID=UPI0036BC0F04
MVTTVSAPPRRDTPARLALGFLTGGVIGASLAGFVAGCATGRAPLIVASLALPAAYGLVFFLAGARRRAREAAVAPRTALAVIESMEATRGEDSDVPVRFVLTVVPDGAPAYRVEIRQEVHRSELPDHRPRGTVVVEYPPDRPWRVRIVRRPTPRWEDRAAATVLDPVAGPVLKSESPEGCAGGFLTLLGLLLGAAVVVLSLSRADLLGSGTDGASPEPPAPSSSSTSTAVVTSAIGTVVPGQGRSMLDRGELRRAVDSLLETGNHRRALTVVVQERLLTVVFAPGGTPAPGFDPRSLPYERLPALVEEAGTTPGVGAPRTWQITVDGVTGALTLRVTVTGDGGTGSLETDGRGKVLRRTGG